MIKIFHYDDTGYEEWLCKIGGFVYNDFGGRIVEYKKLHKSDCTMLHNVRSKQSKTSVRKICSDNLSELRQYLSENRGGEGIGYSLCGYCFKADETHFKVRNERTYSSYFERQDNLIQGTADTIAKNLISIYNEKKVPKYYREFYLPLGLTKKEVESDPNKIYMMIVLAAYDRQPYTKVAKGWEGIWGTRRKEDSLYTKLDEVGLLSLEVTSALTKEEILIRLQQKNFYGYKIDSDGVYTDYSRTIIDTVHIIQECKLLNLMIKASTPEDVSTIFNILDSVHGIGPTIASKLVMYTLREIGVGQIPYKNLYPAVIPIIKEYHNSELGKELKQKYGANAITIIFESLKKLGDPFAIDALYYIHREEPSLKKLL